ncbi:MAG: lipoyl(octanoyl) transferase LipB [Crocinitomicaceae bacterium]|nr:lipoyl(octanoyl) transferase LipB [Crocinitomicaceae bacterium]
MSRPKVTYHPLGNVDYKIAWDYQELLFNGIISSKQQGVLEANSHLITCEHPHVFTLGKSGKLDHLLADEAALANIDAKFYQINRGGGITYHGPGQLVVYPILDLDQFFTDIHKYMRFLEEAVILTLADFGLIGHRIAGLTGVWIDMEKPRKISAFGVKSSRWVTMHGIGFNVNTDLAYFDQIIPCGISDKQVTSMKQELGYALNMDEVTSQLVGHLGALFDFDLIVDDETK